MPQFLEKIAEVLEVPSVTPDFAFRSAPGLNNSTMSRSRWRFS